MKNTVILIGGPPASGKSSLAESISKELQILHIDIDEFVKNERLDPDGPDKWKLFFKKYLSYLENNESIIVSATFREEKTRHDFYKTAKLLKYNIHLIFLNAPSLILYKRYESRPAEKHFVNQDNGRDKLSNWMNKFSQQNNYDLGKEWTVYDSHLLDQETLKNIIIQNIKIQ